MDHREHNAWGMVLSCSMLFLGLATGFVLGTFGEYWIHRAMHGGFILTADHGEHHREGIGHGVLREFRSYSVGTLIIAVLVAPIVWVYGTTGALAIGLICGLLAHAMLAAWCHQAQHEDPRLVPWLSATPVHFVHHALAQSRHNFGISVDWWDRLFGTYKPEPNWRSRLDPGARQPRWWQIDWLDRPDPVMTHR
jgi:sterol desaturase/sphingolipid hydroxylase (fatty acid hydroxylase superfamily)